MAHRSKLPPLLLGVVLILLAWSGLAPHDRFTWLLEIFPILIAVPILVLTYQRFPLSNLAYTLLAVHAGILMLGGHYTYAEVPLGFWMEGWFGFTRNNYDRIGHFAQGFIPAVVAREILLRTSPLRPGKWLTFLVICFCLALSATYELVEWATAVATGTAADAFLGTQGDPWDTQWDMFFALIGSVAATVLLGKVVNRVAAGMRGGVRWGVRSEE